MSENKRINPLSYCELVDKIQELHTILYKHYINKDCDVVLRCPAEVYYKIKEDIISSYHYKLYGDIQNGSITPFFNAVLEKKITPAGKEVEELEDENKRLRGALEFYADKYNWYSKGVVFSSTIINNDTDPIDAFSFGGRRAREALK